MNTYKGFIVSDKQSSLFENNTVIPKNGIFVFGSNTQGRHGKGAAKTALNYFGAIYGKAEGLQGSSYAIITKDLTKFKHPSISKDFISEQIKKLYEFAIDNQHLKFYIAYSGTSLNLNGYSNKEMAELFNQYDIPENVYISEGLSKLMTN